MNASNLKHKRFFIREYFNEFSSDIKKAAVLALNRNYSFEGLLVLLCYIDAIAASRYTTLKSGRDRYIKIIQEYAGCKKIYNKVDLYYFLRFREYTDKPIKKFICNKIQYKEMKKNIEKQFGTKDTILDDKRYITTKRFANYIKPIPGTRIAEINKCINIFSNAGSLYTIFRCSAVHNKKIALYSKVYSVNGTNRLRCHTIITPEIIVKTATNIIENLKRECLRKSKWFYEL